MSTTPHSLLALTMGDAAGIGPEIIAQCYTAQPALMRGTLVYGDVACMRRAAAVAAMQGGPALPVAVIDTPQAAWGVPVHCIPVLQVDKAIHPPPWGKVSAESGAMAGRCVAMATDAALNHQIAGLVTAPLHKEALYAAGAPFNQFPGHTEMLQAAAAIHAGVPVAKLPVRMMLANDEMRTVLVSIHVSLVDAIAAVTLDNVLQTLLITDKALSAVLGRRPRMGVAGLNPHAGEGGLFGREEIEIIQPAIEQARHSGCQATGPWAPDTVFMRARNTATHPGEFDVVIAMYHDQGLIPVKYLGVEKGVNVTLGLPLIRTSPDHGTAFDIAGTGKADPASLLEAVRVAKALANLA